MAHPACVPLGGGALGCVFFISLMQTYNHPFIEYGQMSAALISKGMSGNSSVIELRLEDVGYQRLSAYWKPFLDYKGNRGWSKQPQFAKNQWEWYAAYDETSGKWIPDSTKSRLSFSQSKTGVILTICYLLLKQVASTSQWKARVFHLFAEPRFAALPLTWMGLPRNWETHPLWQ